jgi:acetyltransferase-like isoleucine patch superfamily enzyme
MIIFIKDLLKRILYLRKLKKAALIGKNFIYNKNTFFSSYNRSQIEIEDNVMFFGKIICDGSGNIKISSKTSVREGCIFYCSNSIIIHEGVIFADNVIVSDTNHHPVSPIDRKKMVESGWSTDYWKWKHAKSSPIEIEENVWIGQYSRILKGVHIGKNSIVASNSVVTSNVPANSIVGGNPARVIKVEIDKIKPIFG